MEDIFLKCKEECVGSAEEEQELKQIEDYLCYSGVDDLDILVGDFDYFRTDFNDNASDNALLSKTIWAKIAAIINRKPEPAPPKATTSSKSGASIMVSPATTNVSVIVIPTPSTSNASAPATKPVSSSLLRVAKNKKYEYFETYVTRPKKKWDGNKSDERNNSNSTHISQIMEAEKWKFLREMEELCSITRLPLTEWLVTGYHVSELPINEYLAQNELFNQMHAQKQEEEKRSLSRSVGMTDKLHEYLSMYEKHVAKPLHKYVCPDNEEEKLAIAPFRDRIDIIVQYMNEINAAIKNVLLSKYASYPIQLDVYFVAPKHPSTQTLDLHALPYLIDVVKSDKNSRQQGLAGIAVHDIYNLLRNAATNMNRRHCQRFIMLVVRQNEDDTADDSVYLYRPDGESDSVPDKRLSDFCELLYLMNSTSEIVPGLKSTAQGVLGWTQHLHSKQCNKVYLSYGEYKSRVFKADFLKRLRLIFDDKNGGKHDFDPRSPIRDEFQSHFHDLDDVKYAELGEYWFNNARQYECFEPAWNTQNCRAKNNVFIPKESPPCTADLLAYIDEKAEYETPGQLYYKMDYTMGMQVCDKETVAIRFGGHAGAHSHKVIGLINTELHREGHVLYAVMEANDRQPSRQKWKIVSYSEHISEAFMTAAELYRKYGVFSLDLPQGSKNKHKDWEAETNEIEITESLIRSTNWNHVRVVQSTQNCDKMEVLRPFHLTDKKFKQLAVKSMKQYSEQPPLCMAQFKFRKNQYHLEKLLPVFIPQVQKYVAISFWYNRTCGKGGSTGHTQASGICLDLIDLRNKACLIQSVPHDSWLNQKRLEGINNLIIGEYVKQKSAVAAKMTTAVAAGEQPAASNQQKSECGEVQSSNSNSKPKKKKKKKKQKKPKDTSLYADAAATVESAKQTKPVQILKPTSRALQPPVYCCPRRALQPPVLQKPQQLQQEDHGQVLPRYPVEVLHHLQDTSIDPDMYPNTFNTNVEMPPVHGFTPNAETFSACSSLDRDRYSYSAQQQLTYQYQYQYAQSAAPYSSLPPVPDYPTGYSNRHVSVPNNYAYDSQQQWTGVSCANDSQHAYALLSTPAFVNGNTLDMYSEPVPQTPYYSGSTSDASYYQQRQITPDLY